MERNLYLKCLKGSGWVLDGLKPRKGYHFYLKLFSDDDGYPIEDGMYEITSSCYWDELHYGITRTHSIYIDLVMQFVEKGYAELVEDPTDYSQAMTSAEIMEESTRLWGDHLYDENGDRIEGL